MLISDLITDLISDFGIASMLNYTANVAPVKSTGLPRVTAGTP